MLKMAKKLSNDFHYTENRLIFIQHFWAAVIDFLCASSFKKGRF